MISSGFGSLRNWYYIKFDSCYYVIEIVQSQVIRFLPKKYKTLHSSSGFVRSFVSAVSHKCETPFIWPIYSNFSFFCQQNQSHTIIKAETSTIKVPCGCCWCWWLPFFYLSIAPIHVTFSSERFMSASSHSWSIFLISSHPTILLTNSPLFWWNLFHSILVISFT